MSRLPSPPAHLLPWLDVTAIAAWGILLLKYWITGKLGLLIHPNYTWLTVLSGLSLLGLGGLRGYQLWQARTRISRPTAPNLQHLTLLPPGWGSCLMIAVAILGLTFTPRAFASETALQRGLNDNTLLTQVKPQAFRTASKPEDRSLVEWIRTLQLYPEPDAYAGQKVKVRGFAVHPQSTSAQYLLITRFVITCCAADAYPISLPVKLAEGADRRTYPVDQWFEVEGKMLTETLNTKRQAVIQATALKPVEEPANPYDY
jgi:uncharacterized repeat protein (TIGR03943 family)